MKPNSDVNVAGAICQKSGHPNAEPVLRKYDSPETVA